jgi:hypothetical protein
MIKNLPELIIFDIDGTLLKPNIYFSEEQVLNGLYDKELLKTFLSNKKYQVAIASLNTDFFKNDPNKPICGHRLGRTILDLQYPNSKNVVPDEFIQAWRNINAMVNSKEEHLTNIIKAYVKKYFYYPYKIVFYDDQIEQVYIANKLGINGYWVPNGLTRITIDKGIKIRNKVSFTIYQATNLNALTKIMEKYKEYIRPSLYSNILEIYYHTDEFLNSFIGELNSNSLYPIIH